MDIFTLIKAFGGAFVFCSGFSLLNGVRGRTILYCSLGGALGWLSYVIFRFHLSEDWSVFLATIILAVYAEIMARLLKKPSSIFLIIALLPLVPGAAIFYAMRVLVARNAGLAWEYGLQAFTTAGLMALAIMTVSSVAGLGHKIKINIRLSQKL